jgi:cysteinyl-tRNA synthetase
MKYILSIYDTLTKQKKKINFLEKNRRCINIYVCGITPYDHAHVGHARCYVSYDILIRLIRFFNGNTTYIQNITDVNDKIFDKAISWYNDPSRYLEVANFYHNNFRSLLSQLGCLSPDFYPRVSESIQEIIHLIQKIIDYGYAYKTNDGVYFKTAKYKEYGILSQREITNEKNISRLEDTYEKTSESDFALWKITNTTPYFASPWGNGLPGWHIECSAMIKKSFGENKLDIHGGGMDLLFPHHENEKAQSECCSNMPLTDIWMHVAFINVNKEKMSKSKGNSFYLQDIINQFDPMVFRLYLLMHHYNSPIEFDLEAIKSVNETYQSLISIFINDNTMQTKDYNAHFADPLIDEIYQLLFDNLNTAAVIGLIFKNKNNIKQNRQLSWQIEKIVKYILGLSLHNSHNAINPYSPEIQDLIEERELARKNKNFLRADEIRKILIQLGVSINDTKL